MPENFKSRYTVSSSIENLSSVWRDIPVGCMELLREFGGNTFKDGLYSIHTFEEARKWSELLWEYFKGYRNEIISFGHDWMGRQFCVPLNGNAQIYLFDPATLEDMLLEENLYDFHEVTLLDENVDTLDEGTFYEILDHLNLSGIGYKKCLGFKIPLFLNGTYTLSNYELCDLEVYWDIQHQLYRQIKDLPGGTRISNSGIDPFSK